jgi:predicted membrane protein
MDSMRHYRHRQPAAQIVIGVTIAILGLLFTLDNLHILRARDYLPFWPLVLVAVGLAQLLQARSSARVWSGSIWIIVGGVLLLERFGWWDINVWALWPLALVFLGGRIFWRALHPHEPHVAPFVESGAFATVTGSTTSTAAPTVSGVAVMGSFNRKVVSTAFERADLTALMGGGKLDLREASIAGRSAVVEVFALMGGFEIMVPTTWDVDVEVLPLMGNCDDKTMRHPEGTAPRLIVRGFVMMGGVDIRN